MPNATDAATLQAYFEGIDNAARTAEEEWGVGRLPHLIDDELRAKFYRQQALWRATYDAAWNADVLTGAMLVEVEQRAAAMRRAWAAIQAAASEAGHRPIHAEVWEARLPDGTVAAIVRTDAEVAHVVASGRHTVVYTVDEIASVIGELFPKLITDAKRLFPGAKVKARGDAGWVKQGDEAPF